MNLLGLFSLRLRPFFPNPPRCHDFSFFFLKASLSTSGVLIFRFSRRILSCPEALSCGGNGFEGRTVWLAFSPVASSSFSHTDTSPHHRAHGIFLRGFFNFGSDQLLRIYHLLAAAAPHAGWLAGWDFYLMITTTEKNDQIKQPFVSVDC